MKKLRALLLTEGMHGMISQVEGLAKALKTDFQHIIVRLNWPWNLISPYFTPLNSLILKNHIKIIQYPDYIISCGRKSVVPSLILKKKSKGKSKSIHIQDPKLNINKFDFIVSPEHDGLRGHNIINTKGALHYLTKEEIENEKNYLQGKLSCRKIVSFILGGANKYYNFSTGELQKIFEKIKLKFIDKGYGIIVVPSMRTPKEAIVLASNFFTKDSIVIKQVDKKAYLSALGLGDIIVVTCDSISMISEASISNKPIIIAHMNSIRNNYRFKIFFKLFNDLGITRDLEEENLNWNYKSLNEAERVASLINKKY